MRLDTTKPNAPGRLVECIVPCEGLMEIGRLWTRPFSCYYVPSPQSLRFCADASAQLGRS
jgi:hypothetical protein